MDKEVQGTVNTLINAGTSGLGLVTFIVLIWIFFLNGDIKVVGSFQNVLVLISLGIGTCLALIFLGVVLMLVYRRK